MVSLSLRQQDGIRRLMSKTILNKELPAMFFAATDANGEFFSHQAGTTAEDAPIFWVCSQTKLITSIAAMQLIEQGKIQLSTPVAQILPELANPIIVTSALDQDGKMANTEITFLHLLTQAAWNIIRRGPFPAQPIKFEPGTDFAYGFSTDCVGFIVERLSGKSLDTYFKDHIFSPLGITSATFYLTPALKERLLPLSFRNPEGKLEPWNDQVPTINQDPEKTNVHFGGAGLYMTLRDYLTVLRHLLQVKDGKAVNPILKEDSVTALFMPMLPAPALASLATMLGIPSGAAQHSTGMMLETADFPGRRKKGSGSWGGWACTSFFVDPETGIAAVWGTQLIHPSGWDAPYQRFEVELEQALYAGLEI